MRLLSDSMADEDRADFGDLALAVLDLFALYDRVLDVIWWFGRDTFRADHDSETPSLSLEHFRRERDGEQGRLFVRLANQLNIPGDRSNFAAVFSRVKDTRNHIAHAPEMNATTHNGHVAIGIPFYQQNAARVRALDGPSLITLPLVQKRVRNAHWLLQHVDWCRVHMDQFGGPMSYAENAPTSPPPRIAPR